MDSVMLGSVLSASLLGSLHCAGMCGGLVTLYAGQSAPTPSADGSSTARANPPEWAVHSAYNLGRLSVYAVLGFLAGTLGAGLNLAGAMLQFQDVATKVAGIWMILWGFNTLRAYVLTQYSLRQPARGSFGQSPDGQRTHLDGPPLLTNPLKRLSRYTFPLYQRLRTRPGMASSFVIGTLSGLLPCGWLFLFVGTATGAGGGLEGASLMAVFWLGTLPAMASLGMLVRRVSGPLRKHLPMAAALLLVCAGLYAITAKGSHIGAGPTAFQRGAQPVQPSIPTSTLSGGQDKPDAQQNALVPIDDSACGGH